MTQKLTDRIMVQRFLEYPPEYRKKLMGLRRLIYKCANRAKPKIKIVETLKWGEPSYLPEIPKVGTTVRINWLKSKPTQYGIYFNCQTTLVEEFKKDYGSLFKCEGKRAIIFQRESEVPAEALSHCIMKAFTYHSRKKSVKSLLKNAKATK